MDDTLFIEYFLPLRTRLWYVVNAVLQVQNSFVHTVCL
jgi:hypothetical protein